MKPLFLVFLGAAAATLPAALSSENPNIILFMADDMGIGDTSAYQDFTGNADGVQISTPNMERLARLGVRFTDAHTPSSRCSPTRYGLLTGRYPWRNRLKCWVLFGSQGDPMIEPDRPTLATLLRGSGYATGMVGKWHVGLRYRRADRSPAAGWDDADISQPLLDTPLDHGFNYARFTSRSHGTSGPDASSKKNSPGQNVGPGHIHGRRSVSATGDGKRLVTEGDNAYVLTELGRRHSNNAIDFLSSNIITKKPFFLYYPSNSNHGPYTPGKAIADQPVSGAARTKSGDLMDKRHDFIYENDVALGRLLDWLEATDDPRAPGQKLAANTLVIFTSDNGAEIRSKVATGPFRSHKGSVYEGGHRVPFIASWPSGKIVPGTTSTEPIGLQDLFATFAEILGEPLPDLEAGRKGAEDSFSVLPAFRGKPLAKRPPLFFNDHSESKADPAVAAIRLDNPTVDGKEFKGRWKLFFDARLLRSCEAHPFELYNLADDPKETSDLLDDPEFAPLVTLLTDRALLHRNSGGHRIAEFAPGDRIFYDFRSSSQLGKEIATKPATAFESKSPALTLTVSGNSTGAKATFTPNPRGLGISGGKFAQVESGESLTFTFDRDVLVESAAIVAGNGTCGGFYTVGDHAPLAIYCIDADNDAKDQQGILSDIGVLKAGQTFTLDSSPHYGVEPAGQWRLHSLTVRPLEK